MTSLAAVTQGGCIVYGEDDGYYYEDDRRDRLTFDGLLSVEWTIDGRFDTDLCRVAGARDAEVLVYDRLDTIVFETTEPCENGVLELEVVPGRYDVEITLIDTWGEPITDTLASDVFVSSNDDLLVTFDFDSSLFL